MTIRRLLASVLVLISATFTACGSPVGVVSSDCGLEPGSTCLCADGTYKDLVCTQDGSLYCDCMPAPYTPSEPDAAPDLDASLELDTPTDMPDMPSDTDMLDVDMPRDQSDSMDMLADMLDMHDMAADMNTPADMSDMDSPDATMCPPQGCDPVDCSQLLGNQTLPSPWTQRTIGYRPTDLPVEYGSANGQLCMKAAGDDIWDTSDRFFYISQPVSEDFDLSVKLDAFDASEPFSKIGLMFRATFDADAPFVMLQLNEAQGVSLLGRAAANTPAIAIPSHIDRQAPVWLRLIRRGDTFYGYGSSDGTSWDPLHAFGTQGLQMAGHVGFALSSHAPSLLTEASLTRIDLQTGTPPAEQCPADIACEEVDTYRGIDLARKGGLDPSKFLGPTVVTFQVTATTGEGPGTLFDAMDKANIRSRNGLYSVIEVDTTQVTSPIEVPSYMPPANNVWVKGHGATITSPPGSTFDLLRVNEEVIIEGFNFQRGRHAVFMDNSGNASSRLRSGVWIHHNSFEECEETCIDLPLSLSARRYVTISYNQFGLAATSTGLDAINASNDCNPNMATCILEEGNLSTSIHHNLFGPKVTSGYPRGGAQTLFYDNHIQSLSAPGIDLNTQGRILSRGNIYRGATSSPSVDVFTGGLGVDSRSDLFLDGAMRNVSSSQSPADMYPDYFTFHFLSSDLLIDELSSATGP